MKSFVAQTLLYEYHIKIMAYASLCDLFYASAAWKADLSLSHSLRKKNTLYLKHTSLFLQLAII